MGNEYAQQRHHRRFSVDYMKVEGRAVFTSETVIRNLSVSGVSLVTESRLEAGRNYLLHIIDNDTDITMQGIVRWCSDNDTTGFPPESAHLKYAAGLQFAGLSPEEMSGLARFIEKHFIERHTQVRVHGLSGVRCNIRFHLDQSEKAMLDIAETYRVRKLSLGGMLIESGRAFEPDTRVRMELTIPGDIRLDFVGRVSSCIPSSQTADRVEVGIEFLHMPRSDRAHLKEFIRRLYLEDAGFTI
jgi:hypothetical protein